MTTVTSTAPARPHVLQRPTSRVGRFDAFSTLARRRFSLSAHTPREIIVPLMTPILFSVLIAPALAKSVGSPANGIDYMTFVATGTIGLLVPISCMFAGIGVLVDRESGARRDLLAAPITRPLIVAGNLAVALVIVGLQVVALFGAALLRGADLNASATGIAWFVAASVLLAIAMYGVAEAFANRIPTQEEYVGLVPAVAIVPWFFAGALFPVRALPAWAAGVAKFLPLTHALAVIRYGLVDRRATGLHDIWGMSNPTAMAAMSLLVVAVFAALFTMLAVRAFNRASLQ
jgi:ABC-2 type transport system permease protein